MMLANGCQQVPNRMDVTMSQEELIENVPFDEIHIGQSARLIRTLTVEDVQSFAAVSGDVNPAHLDKAYADSTRFHGVIGHGMWGGALISSVLGTQFPGPGTIYLSQSLKFMKPVHLGDTLTVSVTVSQMNPERKTVVMDCLVTNQKQEAVITGEALVMAPTEKIRRPRVALPAIHVFDPEKRLQAFLETAQRPTPTLCGVVHPCEGEALRAVLRATELGLIEPVVFAPEARLRAIAEEEGLDLNGLRIESVAHSHAAAEQAALWAADLVSKQVPVMMLKGSLHTDELMHALISNPTLRTKRRASHIFRMDAPMYTKPLLISDAALNIQPTLEEKVDIVQNAIDAAHALGVANPKVALLSAVETVTAKIASTLDAAALCKMADRGQIKGATLDGPLAFDNSISVEAARIKGIVSPVAGDADVLIVPDLESGNMLAKQLEYLGGAASCGVVLGLRVPVALTSRADGVASRVASVAFALRVAAYYAEHQP